MKEEKRSSVFLLKISVILSGAMLEVAGIAMILLDLKSAGQMSVKTFFIEGQVNATYIGLFVILLGVVLQIVAIMRKYNHGSTTEGSSFHTSRAAVAHPNAATETGAEARIQAMEHKFLHQFSQESGE